MKPIHYSGAWWLPSDPGMKFHGIIEGDGKRRPLLTLAGTFPSVASWGKGSQIGVIHGLGKRGEHITLCGNYCTSSTLVLSAGIPGSTFSVGVAIIGQHFETIEEIKFASVAGAFQHLADWTGLDPIRARPVPATENNPAGIDLNLRAYAPLTFLAGDTTVSFGVDYEYKIEPRVHHGIDLTHWMTLTPAEPIGLEESLNLMHSAQTFVALGLRWPTLANDARCRSTKATGKGPDVHLHYASAVPLESSRFPELATDRCFQAAELVETLGKSLRMWFGMPHALDTVKNLFFSRHYAEAIYLQHDYITLVQAIESFHRETRGGRFLAKPIWKAVRHALWTAIDSKTIPLSADDRAAIKQRLSHVAEHTLASRLDDLLEIFKDFTVMFVPDRTDFIRNVIKVRNYWTHYDSKRATGRLDELEIHALTIRLETLMELCWANYIEVPRAVMVNIATRGKDRGDAFSRLNPPSPLAGAQPTESR